MTTKQIIRAITALIAMFLLVMALASMCGCTYGSTNPDWYGDDLYVDAVVVRGWTEGMYQVWVSDKAHKHSLSFTTNQKISAGQRLSICQVFEPSTSNTPPIPKR